MQVDQEVTINLTEQLVYLLAGYRRIAEGCHVGGEPLTGQYMMNGRVFIKLRSRRQLPEFEHLTELFIAYKELVDFVELFLEDEVLGVFEDFLAVESYDGLPHLFVEWEIDPLACVLIKALEVPGVDIDSLCWDRAIWQVSLDLTGYVFPIDNPGRFPLPVLQVCIPSIPDKILTCS